MMLDQVRAETLSHINERRVTQKLRWPSGHVTEHLPYATDEILVRFKSNVSANVRLAAHAQRRTERIKVFRHMDGLELVKIPQGASLQSLVKDYRNRADVLYAEPNYLVERLGAPNDPAFPLQWNLQNIGQNGGTVGADIKAIQAWSITTGSNNVVVAVLDTGVDYYHQDLAANIWRNSADCNNNGVDDDGNGYIDDCYGINSFSGNSDPMDDDGHGTHIAGIIGARGNNAIGVSGINWNVKIMACKFIGVDGFGTVADAIECLDYIKTMKDRGVNVIATNNSWGTIGYSQALFDAIDAHRHRGMLFVSAAGDGLVDNDEAPTYPANFFLPNIVVVGASYWSDCKSGLSRHGRRTVHLTAPGESIVSTGPDNSYTVYSGTSMAAAHVTGVVALLYAQNIQRDWKTVKNLILSGGDVPRCDLSPPEMFVTGKRLSAYGALSCSNAIIRSRLRPIAARTADEQTEQQKRVQLGLGRPLTLAVLNINCGEPNGDVIVTVNPGGQTIVLRDDGAGVDVEPADGIYSNQWIPPAAGVYTFSFPDNDLVTVEVDPHLKLGFPVKTLYLPGSYFAGPKIHTLVGNIDADPKQEILATGLSTGPLYAWNHIGNPVTGWPGNHTLSAAYPALGELTKASKGYEIVAGYMPDEYPLISKIFAYQSNGEVLTGWPRYSANYTDYPPTLADVDGDGIDEIFIQEEDGLIHAYRADGSSLSGWPAGGFPQGLNTPVVADLDGDGVPEIITATEAECGSTCISRLYAFHRDGTPVAGFPVSFRGGADSYLAVGDVDGDGSPEIVVWGSLSSDFNGANVFANNGVLKATIPIPGSADFGTAPALADLDGDGVPEIIIQTDEVLTVFRGNGIAFPGWPVYTRGWQGYSSPVVGDVDGDGLPDIVITVRPWGESDFGELHAYNRNGGLLSGFPKRLPIGYGAVPAIADIDLNGRNDIIVSGSAWFGVAGEFDRVWAYELGGTNHGPIQWGQFMEGPKHQGVFRGPFYVPNKSILTVKKVGSGTGVVQSVNPAIACGSDCSKAYTSPVSVLLSALPDPGSVFVGWSGEGCTGVGVCRVEITRDTVVTASFNLAAQLLRRLDIASGNPNEGVRISGGPPDINGSTPWFTPMQHFYPDKTTVFLHAPTFVEDKIFLKWQRNGIDYASNPDTQVVMNADYTMTAIYGPIPSLTVNDASIVEGDSGSRDLLFTVTLSVPHIQPVSVEYTTTNGTAEHRSDYLRLGRVVFFNPGETSKTIAIKIYGDKTPERDESFEVHLINPINATILRGRGVGTIINDDHCPASSKQAVDIEPDCKNDLTIYRRGAWFVYDKLTGALKKAVWTGYMTAEIPTPGDYDGDGITDLSTYRNGAWLFFDNTTGALIRGVWTGGVAGDIPVPGDYDGDGKTDIGIYRKGAWLIYDAFTGALKKAVWTGYQNGEIPVPGDYDGDGVTDLASFRNGAWLIFDNTTGALLRGVWTGGVVGDVPVPGDYDGDGVTDAAIYRSGAWIIYDNVTGAIKKAVWTGAQPGEIPTPGDYDGDGITDLSSYRNGGWLFFNNTTGALAGGVWTGGVAGDMPVSAKVPVH